MRIAHLCLSNWFVPDFAYQENQLVEQHRADGHEVLVIASTEIMTKSGDLAYLTPGHFLHHDGVEVFRLPYRFWPLKLARKIRAHPRVYELLESFRPDSILFHGAAGWEVQNAARYAKDHPNVFFYIDSHEDKYNSARGLISREILHKLFYRYCLLKALPYARKFLCYSTESIEFVTKYYRIPRDQTELFPLGGNIPDDENYTRLRNQNRKTLGISDKDIVFIQSGKFSASKMLNETLSAFLELHHSNAKLIVAGSLDEVVEAKVQKLMTQSPNILFLGWQAPADLEGLLCASDVYVQPGTQSVTMQNSMCCRCAQIIADVPAHQIYSNSNGWLITNSAELKNAMFAAMEQDVLIMGQNSYKIALRLLDYKMLAKRVLKP